MRRFLISILVVLLLTVCPLASLAQKLPMGCTSPATTSCPAGTYLFAWNGDHTLGTTYGCNAAKEAVEGTASAGLTISADYGQTGNGMLIAANDNYLTFAVSSQDLIREDVGTIWFDVRIPSEITSATAYILEALNSSNTTYLIRVNTNSSEQAIGNYRAGGTYAATGGASTVMPTETYVSVGYSWDAPNDDHCITVCAVDGTGCTTWDDEDLNDSMDDETWESHINELTLGERRTGGTFTEDLWIDNVFVLEGYKTARP